MNSQRTAMPMDFATELTGLTDGQLADFAGRLARRARLDGPVRGRDAGDFIHDAIGKVLSGERALHGELSLGENLVSIGASLVWSERKKRVETSTPVVDIARPEERVAADAVPLLDRALSAVDARLRDRDHDALAFVRCLRDQIERRGSIAPIAIAKRLGWTSRRARRAWRQVRTIVRREMRSEIR